MKKQILSMWMLAVIPIVGEGVVSLDSSDAPWMCKVTIAQGATETLCSGSLISDTQVLTAGHCFGKNFSSPSRVKVECDGEFVSYGKAVKLPKDSDWIYNTHSEADVPTPSRDFAVLTLSSNRYTKDIPLMKMLKDPALMMDGPAVRADAQCAIYGFGLNNSGGTGRLMKADLKNMLLSIQAGILVMKNIGLSFLHTSVDHGDSGGALVCKSPVDQELYEIGVNGSFHYVGRQSRKDYVLFAPTWLNLSNP